MEAIGDDGTYDHASARPATEVVNSGYTYFEQGDVVRARVTPCFENGKGALLSSLPGGRGLGTTELFVFKPSCAIDARYLFYVTASQDFTGHGTATIYGAHGVRRVDDQFARDYRVWLPPLATQRAIAGYLDRETARIDALTAAKKRMVGLLEDRRNARRDDMLTNVGAPVIKLGRFVRSIGQGVSPQAEDRSVDEDEWGVLKLSAVKGGYFIPSEHKALPADVLPIPAMVPCPGDLLVTRANTPSLVGDACAVTVPAPRLMLCDLIYALRLTLDLDPEYAAHALLTRHARGQLSSTARGTSQSMVKLRGEDVKSVAIPIPPIVVQRSLVAALNRENRRIDAMAEALSVSITLLQERRQALITAAVTSELDIPGAAV